MFPTECCVFFETIPILFANHSSQHFIALKLAFFIDVGFHIRVGD
jgi:hypothetical protein